MPETVNIEDSEIDSEEVRLQNTKKMEFIPSVARTLTEDDIKSPAFFKMLLSENEKNEKELSSLNNIKDKYYDCERNLAVAEEKLKIKTSIEIFSDVIYSIGGILLAVSGFDLKNNIQINNGIFIFLGLSLIIGTAVSKWWRNK
jgi:hypothetical protein